MQAMYMTYCTLRFGQKLAPTFTALIPARWLGRFAPSSFALAFSVALLPQALCFAFALLVALLPRLCARFLGRFAPSGFVLCTHIVRSDLDKNERLHSLRSFRHVDWVASLPQVLRSHSQSLRSLRLCALYSHCWLLRSLDFALCARFLGRFALSGFVLCTLIDAWALRSNASLHDAPPSSLKKKLPVPLRVSNLHVESSPDLKSNALTTRPRGKLCEWLKASLFFFSWICFDLCSMGQRSQWVSDSRT